MDAAPEFFKSLHALLCSPVSIPTYNPNLLCSYVVISFPTWLTSQKACFTTRDSIWGARWGFLNPKPKLPLLWTKERLEPRDWDVGEMVDGDLTNYFGFDIGEFSCYLPNPIVTRRAIDPAGIQHLLANCLRSG